jgi:hypothetical protein
MENKGVARGAGGVGEARGQRGRGDRGSRGGRGRKNVYPKVLFKLLSFIVKLKVLVFGVIDFGVTGEFIRRSLLQTN